MTPCPLPPTRGHATLCPSPADSPAQPVHALSTAPAGQGLQKETAYLKQVTEVQEHVCGVVKECVTHAQESLEICSAPTGQGDRGSSSAEQNLLETPVNHDQDGGGCRVVLGLHAASQHPRGPCPVRHPPAGTAHPCTNTFTHFHEHSLSACCTLLGTDTWTLGHPWRPAGTATVLVLKGTTMGLWRGPCPCSQQLIK